MHEVVEDGGGSVEADGSTVGPDECMHTQTHVNQHAGGPSMHRRSGPVSYAVHRGS